jgi:hypothetical protein
VVHGEPVQAQARGHAVGHGRIVFDEQEVH